MKYNFRKIESKWQKKWEEKKIFIVKENSKKKKFYVLEMFPYPSGAGLHMGHAFNYTIGDIYSRFKRMNGFNVLYPMGYDAFGLPAENAAIKIKEHPRKYTERAIKNYIKQQKLLGLSYDWSRMIKTCDKEYYKWNQFWFLKFLEKGLVYRKKAPVNWCSKCKTVLANEQVHNGKCWRHSDTDVEVKYLEQWFIKITNYADELLDCIDDLDWPEKIKIMQKNWIGKSFGTEIDFEIENNNISNCIIIHGSNKRDLERMKKEGLPQQNKRHWIPWIKKELEKRGIKCFTPLMPKNWEPKYNEWKKEFEKLNVNEESILIGHSAGGDFLVRWLGETKKKIKKLILVAPGKLVDNYSEFFTKFCDFEIDELIKESVSEIIIFKSDNDNENILKSAKLYYEKLGGRLIELKRRGHFIEKHMGTKEFPELLNEISSNQKFPVFTTRPDTIYGVTFMVISAQHPKLMELVTKEQKKEVGKFLKKIKSVSEKEIKDLEKEGVFTGSYALNPLTNEKVPIYTGNFVVADYGSGMVMGVPAHDQRDFVFAKKYGLEIKQVVQPQGYKINEKKLSSAYTQLRGDLINSDKFNGMPVIDAKDSITKFLKKNKLGRKKVQYKLRDWLISRQRYWGTPIPIVYCDKCGIVPVPEKDLPVELPKKVKFGKGNPLKTNKNFLEVKCPECGAKARRETDTIDTFFDSSWYYIRYCDNKNNKKAFDKKKVKYWMPVDQYIGGAEHACMHLLYARFFTKSLRDLGYVNYDEPFTKLFNQGMLHASDGQKMSKSLGNVVLPEEVSNKYGIDAARLFLMSMASPDKDSVWNEKIVLGSHKFLNKVYDYFNNIKIGKPNPKIVSKLNKTIKEVTGHVENFKYNLAVIKIRGLFNSFPEEVDKDVLEKFLKLLHPFCPHITEEFWERLGHKNFISLEKWPVADEKKIDESFEKQEEMVDKLVSDINQIIKLTGHHPTGMTSKEGGLRRSKDFGKKSLQGAKKVYVYVLPNEKKVYVENLNLIRKKISLDMDVYAVNDKSKYDPENKSKKVKPGRPGIYLE